MIITFTIKDKKTGFELSRDYNTEDEERAANIMRSMFMDFMEYNKDFNKPKF